MSTSDSIFNGRAARAVFGAGSRVHIERELLALRAQKALILFGQEQLALGTAVADQLGSHAAGVFDRATMHVPAELVTEARAVATSLGADCLISGGGGLGGGLATAISLEAELPPIEP